MAEEIKPEVVSMNDYQEACLERDELRQNSIAWDALEEHLVWLYNKSPLYAAAVECLCDERFDKSGAMLGRIRALTRTF